MPSCSHFHTSRLCWPLPGAEPSLHMQNSHCAAIKLCIVDRFPLAVLGSMSSGLTRKCAVPCLSCGNGASSKSIRELRPCTTYSDSSEDVHKQVCHNEQDPQISGGRAGASFSCQTGGGAQYMSPMYHFTRHGWADFG